jgi:hypothetical protein
MRRKSEHLSPVRIGGKLVHKAPFIALKQGKNAIWGQIHFLQKRLLTALSGRDTNL